MTKDTDESSRRFLSGLDEMYDEYGPKRLSIFAGNFINFGYWANIDYGSPIGVDERIRSEQDLYRLVLNALRIAPGHHILEVGCGAGAGTALARTEFQAAQIHGLDVSPARIAQAKALADGDPRLVFEQGSALDMPYAWESFDGIFSVAAVQHFGDLATFALQAHRILRPAARLAVAAFFLPREGVAAELADLVKTVGNGNNAPAVIDDFRDTLADTGFTDLTVESIGRHVWAGFDAWVAQTDRGSWTRNWFTAYRRGLIDYFLVVAVR